MLKSFVSRALALGFIVIAAHAQPLFVPGARTPLPSGGGGFDPGAVGAPEKLVIFVAAVVIVGIGVLWGLYGMRNQHYCPKCRHQQTRASRFCRECGNPLTASSEPRSPEPRSSEPQSSELQDIELEGFGAKRIFKGHELYWEANPDGSEAGVFLTAKGKIVFWRLILRGRQDEGETFEVYDDLDELWEEQDQITTRMRGEIQREYVTLTAKPIVERLDI
jgi:hypothetical protein